MADWSTCNDTAGFVNKSLTLLAFLDNFICYTNFFPPPPPPPPPFPPLPPDTRLLRAQPRVPAAGGELWLQGGRDPTASGRLGVPPQRHRLPAAPGGWTPVLQVSILILILILI